MKTQDRLSSLLVLMFLGLTTVKVTAGDGLASSYQSADTRAIIIVGGKISRDSASGLPTGKRQHKPVILSDGINQRALNPQPLPPKSGSARMLNPQPLPPQSGSARMLNPQPLPPASRSLGVQK